MMSVFISSTPWSHTREAEFKVGEQIAYHCYGRADRTGSSLNWSEAGGKPYKLHLSGSIRADEDAYANFLSLCAVHT